MTKSIATASINRETAVALIDAAIAAARTIGIPAAVAVVDATGNLRAFERTDDAPFLTVDVAIDKAWSSASFGYPTHVWNDYVSNDPKVAPLAYRPRMVAVGGGYPILEDGKLIGGIGISGGNYQQDQDACVEALTKIGSQSAQQHRQTLPQGALHLLGACTQLLRHLLHRSPLQLRQEFFAQIHIRHLLISYSLRGQAVCSKRYGGMNA